LTIDKLGGYGDDARIGKGNWVKVMMPV